MFLDFNIALDVVTDLRQVTLHAIGILRVDDLEQFLQLCAYLADLIVGIRVKEDFLKQVVVLIEHPLGNAHVTLEGGTWCILMLHHSCEDKRRYKRD